MNSEIVPLESWSPSRFILVHLSYNAAQLRQHPSEKPHWVLDPAHNSGHTKSRPSRSNLRVRKSERAAAPTLEMRDCLNSFPVNGNAFLYKRDAAKPVRFFRFF